ncbi:DUF1642 domain-containing protein [Streptococcus salivarius]|uniref:DUF1642 domain-containing protein n=1 Tax=Streptococcus salivarius TaxID=1304 RepID=UPI00191877D3|nr:DUF1642 domain-containing protein [Streptococcus salivarius]
MMNKDEAVQKLATVGRLSIAHAEDLYDSFFEKPVVPQYVADWYEENKKDFEVNLFQCIYEVSDCYTVDSTNEFWHWLMSEDTKVITTLVNMHLFGYEVEEKKRYTVRVKGIDGYTTHLNRNLDNQVWFFASSEKIKGFGVEHTRKELEVNGFGWVFSCPGVEVKEVE